MSVKLSALILLFLAFHQISARNRGRPNFLVVMSDAFVSLTSSHVFFLTASFKKGKGGVTIWPFFLYSVFTLKILFTHDICLSQLML